MSTKDEKPEDAPADKQDKKPISKDVAGPKEVGGRNGPEPTRYGDWEKKGIISDF